jgi:DNA invertase Pin-like site-specific DNA recombinase
VSHLLGYARVSTADQNPDLKLDELKDAGYLRIFIDKASGTLDERPQLSRS